MPRERPKEIAKRKKKKKETKHFLKEEKREQGGREWGEGGEGTETRIYGWKEESEKGREGRRKRCLQNLVF